MFAACRRICSPGELNLQPKHVNRIVCGLGLLGLTMVLAGCSGSTGTASLPNKPRPFAVNSYAATSVDVPVNGKIYASSPDNLSLTYTLETAPAHGNVTIDPTTGTYVYTPSSGFAGTDTFQYTVATSNGTSAAATATIQVRTTAQVSVFGAPVYIPNGATAPKPASVNVEVKLSNPPNGQATVNYSTVDGTAKAGTDYTAESGTLSFGPGVTEQTISIPLSDATAQYSRYFRVRLSNPSSNLTIGQAVGNVVLRYWPEPLNDTGITGCATATNGGPVNPDTCPQPGYPVQDGDLGRDPASFKGDLAKVGYGGYTYDFGYDFTKIGFNGKPLFNQAANYSVDPWGCVRDNWSGLEWSVPTSGPTRTSGLYSSGLLLTWYDPNSNTNGGGPGKRNGGPFKMDTYDYVKKVNADKLCGYSDWRLPTANELRNLLDLAANGFSGQAPAGIAPIPSLQVGGYWTATTDPTHPNRAVVISSTYGYDSFLPKNGSTSYGGYFVILVRGGVQ